jgi:ubiquinone/menaquinone biosynthesis C-methylase UbiE
MNFFYSLIKLRYKMTAGYRRRRFELFWQRIGRSAQHHADTHWWLDLGGGQGSYLLSHLELIADNAPRIILLDLGEAELRDAQARYPHIRCVCADGEHLPFRDTAFDLIFCNSVIEHVARPAEFAAEIRRTGRRFFVQTPNGNFPLESHSQLPLPFFRWLPGALQRGVCRVVGAPYEYIAAVHYLREEQLKAYFPDAELVRERAWGLTKSFYALTPPDLQLDTADARPSLLPENAERQTERSDPATPWSPLGAAVRAEDA